jgi:hypothetical protein
VVDAALFGSLVLAWLNFLTTGRWASLPGSLNGWKQPLYAAALIAASGFALAGRRRVGQIARIGRLARVVMLAGLGTLCIALLLRLPPTLWLQIPFKDDWTELFQQTVNGVGLLRRGVVVGWNWWFLGGYPTSTDVAQNFSTVALIPMTVFGDRLGYHVLHFVMFLAVPVFVWWDLRHDDRETAYVATGLAGIFAAGYLGPLGASGDTNSLVGVCCVGLALVASRSARRGSRWGGPVLLLALTLAAYTHTAFFVYAAIYLTLEAVYFGDRSAFLRVAAAAGMAMVAALPAHWESLRHPEYVSFNNTVYEPDAPIDWLAAARTLYYNVEILALPHRWYNDYRSLANVWLPALVLTALLPGRSRTSFYAAAAVVTQILLRFNTSEAGAGFDRIQHMFPLLTAPSLAGFVLRCSGSRPLAAALLVVLGLYVYTDVTAIRHVATLRDFDPPLIDRIAQVDGGSLVLVETSPHRDMDSHPTRRSPTTPFDVHFEGLLPSVAGQRFYSQMIDGWVWNVWRGQVVGAGTFRGRPIAETPPDAFVGEMRRWGVRHLFVWTDGTRAYLARSGAFVERWRNGRWFHFERPDEKGETVTADNGRGHLRNLDWLGADVELAGARAGDEVVIRTNYYPAWRASHRGRPVALYARDGQLAFRAPDDGNYTVALEYPRYRAVLVAAWAALAGGMIALARWPAPGPDAASPPEVLAA